MNEKTGKLSFTDGKTFIVYEEPNRKKVMKEKQASHSEDNIPDEILQMAKSSKQAIEVKFELILNQVQGKIWLANEKKTEGDFNNPYNYTPWQPRDTRVQDEASDQCPTGHHRYQPEGYNGTLSVHLRTETPLLMLDAHKRQSVTNDHFAYPIRRDAQGRAFIPATSLRGLIRSAYETISNSRMDVWGMHAQRLAYRAGASDAKGEAVRIEWENGSWQIRHLSISRIHAYDNQNPRRTQRMSWLHRFLQEERTEQIKPRYTTVGPDPDNPKAHHIASDKDLNLNPFADAKRGFLYVTNQNAAQGYSKPKKYERFFYEDSDAPEVTPISDEAFAVLKRKWFDLIDSYQTAHREQDIWGRGNDGPPVCPNEYKGHNINETAWSRHIYFRGPKAPGSFRGTYPYPMWDMRELQHGVLAYAEFDEKGNVSSLFPVQISRHLHQQSPEELLSDEPDQFPLPAEDFFKLSPAERLFGWVNTNGHGAYKGKLSIFEGHFVGKTEGINTFDPAKTLPILGQPQPGQGRFSLGKRKPSGPDVDGLNQKEKEALFAKDMTIRGRKVYPHHDQIDENNIDDHFRHLLGVTEASNQNKSILDWIPKDTEFSFTLSFSNLSQFELGALFYLLTLHNSKEKPAYFRLGNAKPYGFGSVALTLKMDRCQLFTGKQSKQYYLNLQAPSTLEIDPQIEKCIDHFKSVMSESYGQEFDKLGFITAFEAACRGFNNQLPVHYPTPREPQPNDEKNDIFAWFSENEKNTKAALPELKDNAKGLFYQKK